MKNSQPFIISLRDEVIGFVLIIAVWGVAALFYPPYIIPSPLTVIGFSLAYIAGTLSGIPGRSRQPQGA
jgi:ABC-type nitrate/sulfonate/bicarbonate transport system permease component